jgi:hypothetical protein
LDIGKGGVVDAFAAVVAKAAGRINPEDVVIVYVGMGAPPTKRPTPRPSFKPTRGYTVSAGSILLVEDEASMTTAKEEEEVEEVRGGFLSHFSLQEVFQEEKQREDTAKGNEMTTQQTKTSLRMLQSTASSNKPTRKPTPSPSSSASFVITYKLYTRFGRNMQNVQTALTTAVASGRFATLLIAQGDIFAVPGLSTSIVSIYNNAPTARPTPLPSTHMPTAAQPKPPDVLKSNAFVGGIVFAVLMMLCVSAGSAYFWYTRRRKALKDLALARWEAEQQAQRDKNRHSEGFTEGDDVDDSRSYDPNPLHYPSRGGGGNPMYRTAARRRSRSIARLDDQAVSEYQRYLARPSVLGSGAPSPPVAVGGREGDDRIERNKNRRRSVRWEGDEAGGVGVDDDDDDEAYAEDKAEGSRYGEQDGQSPYG